MTEYIHQHPKLVWKSAMLVLMAVGFGLHFFL